MAPFKLTHSFHVRGYLTSHRRHRKPQNPQNQSQTIHGTGIFTYEFTIQNKPIMSHVDKYQSHGSYCWCFRNPAPPGMVPKTYKNPVNTWDFNYLPTSLNMGFRSPEGHLLAINERMGSNFWPFFWWYRGTEATRPWFFKLPFLSIFEVFLIFWGWQVENLTGRKFSRLVVVIFRYIDDFTSSYLDLAYLINCNWFIGGLGWLVVWDSKGAVKQQSPFIGGSQESKPPGPKPAINH